VDLTVDGICRKLRYQSTVVAGRAGGAGMATEFSQKPSRAWAVSVQAGFWTLPSEPEPADVTRTTGQEAREAYVREEEQRDT